MGTHPRNRNASSRLGRETSQKRPQNRLLALFLASKGYCQVEPTSATIDGWNLLIEVTGFPLKSSAVPFGSTIGSHSAFAMSKICLRLEETMAVLPLT